VIGLGDRPRVADLIDDGGADQRIDVEQRLLDPVAVARVVPSEVPGLVVTPWSRNEQHGMTLDVTTAGPESESPDQTARNEQDDTGRHE